MTEWKITGIPFGLLFEEEARSPKKSIIPTYDEDRDLSLVEVENGHMVPFVECFGVGTDTVTRVRQESTDTDPEDDDRSQSHWRYLIATDTFTKMESEDTDKD